METAPLWKPHRFRRRALAVALFALALPAGALAHVTLSPPFVEAGVATRVALETPNERPPHATTSLVVEAPVGVELAEAGPPPAGWSVVVSGRRARWTGGRIEGERTVSFPLLVTARTRAGLQSLRVTQDYEDGETVSWETSLTVLPAAGDAAPSQRLDRALAAGVVGVVVIAASLVLLRLARRRSLQER